MAEAVNTESDVADAAEIIDAAFRADPVWSVALARADGVTDHCRQIWALYVEGAARYGTAYLDRERRTVSVWVPPGGSELSEEHEAQLDAIVRAVLPAERADALEELFERFENAHPHDRAHYYLGLLATHPEAAGHGYGMAHLAADLARWDAAGIPSYLESSNPANDRRYEGVGYRRIGEFRTVIDGAVVGTYWREAAG